ncbi:hypothetical protein [Marinibactrum halimedae]|uniref:Phage tail protein n=1 Tax=Marinibactrum halimedae TaxID=1444977 RepID=A0AA37T8V5_9GAMM|nr:hypothetical protein [Marinibactrum halimedae]MCD9458887.1 hypothetical protein [Marinibactrum halimedae]GLS27736.1 hypothetical protein GCM10007877_34550 [Marinibactrum halimedae]
MTKPIANNTTPIISQGAELEVEIADSWTLAEGLESIPQFGGEGSYTEDQDIHEITKRHAPGIQGGGELELAFRRIATDAAQNYLLNKAKDQSGIRDDKLARVRVTYRTGDIVTSEILLNGWYLGAANQGDENQMMAVKGQIQNVPEISSVED